MDFLKNFTWTPLNVLKAAVLGLGGLIVIIILFSFVGSFFKSVAPQFGGMGMVDGPFISARPEASPAYYREEAAYDSDYSYGMDGGSAGDAMLSVRNAMVSMPAPMSPSYPQGTTGDDAEEFEVTEYSATVETRNKEETCASVADLKSRSYVVFESANDSDGGCNYTFKVRHANVEEILTFVKGLDPKDLNENTYTIKNQVDDFTSETEILTKKLASIDETLESALAAYDDIQRLATQSQDASARARVIDSKIQLGERLSQERININEQLDRYARMKTEQLDRLEYTYFYISVYEREFIDGDGIKDSWKESIRMFFHDLNTIAQDLTVNLVLLLVMAVQWILYVLILVVIAKYVWKAVKYIWYR